MSALPVAPVVAPPVDLVGRHVALTVPTDGDYPELYHLVNDPGVAPLWRFQARTVSPEEFSSTFWEGTFCNFTARQVVDDRLVGWVLGYNLNLRDGHARFAAVLAPEFHGNGYVLEAVGLLLGYAFAHWPLRKVYAELREDRYLEVASGRDRYFSVEGCLPAHSFLGGTYVDHYIIAVSRDGYERLRVELGPRYVDVGPRP